MNIEQKVKKIDLPVKYTTISIFTMKTSVACAHSRGFLSSRKDVCEKVAVEMGMRMKFHLLRMIMGERGELNTEKEKERENL